MSLSWVNGTVESVFADLTKTFRSSTKQDTGLVYAAAVGMVTGLATEGEQPYQTARPIEERMTDIRTVCLAVRRFEEEVWAE